MRCRFDNVEAALTNNSFTEVEHLDEITKDFGEVACFALQLIGKLCARTKRHELAAEANKRALKLNPFLWYPFADLCNQGQKPDSEWRNVCHMPKQLQHQFRMVGGG